MKIDRLVENLSQDLKPVKPVLPLGGLALMICGISVMIIAGGLAVFPARADIAAKFSNPVFWFELSVPALMLILSAFIFDALSIPGREAFGIRPSWVWLILVSLIGAEFFRATEYSWSETVAGTNAIGALCLTAFLLISVFPTLMVLILAKKRAVTRPLLAGVLIPLVGLAAGMVGIALHCRIDNVIHIALWHLTVPAIIGILVGTLVFPTFLRW